MRKFLLAVAFIATSCLCQAQIYLGGQVSFDYSSSDTKVFSTKTDGPSNTLLLIVPTIGYAFNDKCAIQMGIGFSYAESTETDDGFETEGTYTGWGLSPAFRYTVISWNKLILYGKFGISG